MLDGCRGKQIVEDLRGCCVCGLDRVRVDLRCRCGVDMTEPVRDGGQRYTVGNLQRGVCMAQAGEHEGGDHDPKLWRFVLSSVSSSRACTSSRYFGSGLFFLGGCTRSHGFEKITCHLTAVLKMDESSS